MLKDRNHNNGAHNYPLRDINMMKHSDLVGDQNLTEQELFHLTQELPRVKQNWDMKSVFPQEHDEKMGLDRSGFGDERNVLKFNSELGRVKECKLINKKLSNDICERKLEIPQFSKKLRHCRHFLKGHCNRGLACAFVHDRSIFCSDRQKVFLGGVPYYFSSRILQQKLSELGYTVLNKPRVLPGFSPEVCLGSDQEAQKLIETGSIIFDGFRVSVRPFKYQSHGGKKRSVFLGGLAIGTTASMIKEELEKLDVNVVNHPVVKSGYSPQVMLRSYQEKQKLVELQKVSINGVIVNIRPYV